MAAKVFLHGGANSAPANPLAGLEGPLQGSEKEGKEKKGRGKGKEIKGQKGQEKTPQNKFPSYSHACTH